VLANLAWSVSQLVITDNPLLESISASSIRSLQQFSSLNLANSSWSFALLGFHAAPLLNAISSAARLAL